MAKTKIKLIHSQKKRVQKVSLGLYPFISTSIHIVTSPEMVHFRTFVKGTTDIDMAFKHWYSQNDCRCTGIVVLIKAILRLWECISKHHCRMRYFVTVVKFFRSSSGYGNNFSGSQRTIKERGCKHFYLLFKFKHYVSSSWESLIFQNLSGDIRAQSNINNHKALWRHLRKL